VTVIRPASSSIQEVSTLLFAGEATVMSGSLMRARYAALVLAASALGGCSDGAGPVLNLLHGQWGSAEVSLVAISSGAEVQLRCALIVIEDGIELEDDNSFSVRGRPRTFYSVIEGPLPEVRVTGHAIEHTVSVTFPDPFTGTAATHQLETGVLRSEEPCPQPAAASGR
jgi:hypothetical protein